MEKLQKYNVCGMIEATPTGKLLYIMLFELANECGVVTIPQKKICEALDISRTAVRRNLHRLCYEGYIGIHPRYREDDGSRAANKYTIEALYEDRRCVNCNVK